VFSVFDPVRSSLPYGGRILAINYDASDRPILLVDRWFDIDPTLAAAEFSVVCTLPLGELSAEEIAKSDEIDKLSKSHLVTLPVYSIGQHSPTQRTITLAVGLPEGLKVGATWGLQYREVRPQYFSTVGVEEVGKHKYSVTGLEYHEELFAEVDSDVPYSETPINPNLEGWKNPYPVQNLRLDRTAKKSQGITVFTLNSSWSKPAKGFGFEYEVWLQKGLGNYQFITTTRNTHVDFGLREPDNYCVRVVTIGLQGRRSSPVELCTVIPSFVGENEELISGLEIKNQGNTATFATSDVEFEWRVNSSQADTTFQTGEFPSLPPQVTQYNITIYDTASAIVGEFVTLETYFNLTMARNEGLKNGPHREFIIGVTAQTDDGALSKEVKIRVSNAKPSTPISNFTLEADKEGNAVLTITDPTLLPADYAGIRLWVALTPGFTPTVANMLQFAGTYKVILPLTMGQVNYIRFAFYDTISKQGLDCNISAEYGITPVKEGRLSSFDFMP
jgi:hypothetical protein